MLASFGKSVVILSTSNGRLAVSLDCPRPGGSRFSLSAEEGVYPRFGREQHSTDAVGAFIIGTDNTFSHTNPGESKTDGTTRIVF